MEFQEFVRERKRMCSEMACFECPLNALGFRGHMCSYVCLCKPEEAEKIVFDWSKEHPIMTNREKFMKVFGFDLCATDCNENTTMWLNAEYKEQGGRKND